MVEIPQLLSSSTPELYLKLAVAGSLLVLLLLLLNLPSSRGARRKSSSSSSSSGSSSSSSPPLPPGPRGWPIIGNLLDVGTVPHEGMMKLTRAYGPLVYLRLGAIPHVVSDDPAIIKEFLKIQDHIFASRPGNVILAELLTYGGKDIGFAPYGAHWRNMRKICTLELFSAKSVDSFQRLRRMEMIHTLGLILDAAVDRRAVDLRDAFNGLTSNMMTRMLLGKRYFGPGDPGPEVGAELKAMIAEGILMMNGFNISDYLPFLRFLDLQGQERRMKQIMRHIDGLATALLLELAPRIGKKPESFVDILVNLRGENGEPHLPEDVMKAVMVDMMAAGTDTPGVSCEWAMAELLRDPALLARVREEVDRVVCVDRLVDESDLAHFRLLRAVLKESFRLHPVGAILIPHLAMEDAVVAGYGIPKDTRVLINVFALNRNAQVWERPHEFDPERHLRGLGEGAVVEFGDPECRLIPFGSGRRMCPAASLGLTMVLLALANLVHAFDWEVPANLSMERAPGKMVKAQALTALARPRLPRHLYSQQI
ncbi:cytochrome P450 703A2 [Selaginella moellendorffii]|uniref:cytochrome P450 703A2 n=1 Tax=Selaginella moellendorffii TaxID=88036 RepID=UPI000D1CC31A|nr:cytochrome P450 703A2 [Selaginella moellendorffii]|eukprot:XP_024519339.1 cytochrome P450 703A2 [Selaginella moellendorffii]